MSLERWRRRPGLPWPAWPAWPAWVGLLATLVGSYAALAAFGVPEDLGVYREAAAAALSGADVLYAGPVDRLPYTYPPVAAYLLAPVAWWPPVLGGVLMTTVNVAVLWRLTCLFLPRRALGGSGWPRYAVAAGLLPLARLLEPVWQTFSFGQVNLVLAWLVAEDLLGRWSGRSGRWRGVLLGLAVLVKLTPGIFALVLLFRRDWASLARTGLVVLAGVAVGFVLLPRSSAQFWTSALRDPARVGGVEFAANQSLNGALWRALGPGGSPAAWLLLTLVTLATTAYILIRRGRLGEGPPAAGRDPGVVLAAALAGLLMSPVSWSHHWVWVWPLLVWLVWLVGSTGARVLAIGWAAAAYGWVIWWFPHQAGREYDVGPLGLLLTDAYVVLGLATLVWLAVRSRSPVLGRRRP